MTSPILGPSGLRPRVGLRPTRPQHEAGMRIEPPPSLACASGTMPAATAAAMPEEPPVESTETFRDGQRARSFDFVSGRAPNSGTLVLPSGMRPAAWKRTTSVELKGEGTAGTKRQPSRFGQPFLNPRMSFSKHRYAGERTRKFSLRRCTRLIKGLKDDGVKLRIVPLDPLYRSLDEFNGFNLFLLHELGKPKADLSPECASNRTSPHRYEAVL